MSSAVLDSPRRDVSVISLVGLVHGLSHFLQLALPTMFLAIRHDWNISFAALGLAATVFYVVSGLCQTVAGLKRLICCGTFNPLDQGGSLRSAAPSVCQRCICSPGSRSSGTL